MSRAGPIRAGDWAPRTAVRSMAALYVVFLVALPVAAIAREGLAGGGAEIARALADPTTLGALRLTVSLAFVMAAINAVMGTWIAYVLVRVPFPGRAWVNALVDLPFAVPTLVTGVMLVVLFGPASPLGARAAAIGLRIAFAPAGIVVALLFVTLPFVVRSVQPVLMEMDRAEEEAAVTLGASPLCAFRRVVLPAILPAVAGGTLLGFARALGEFGSVVVVSGNVPGRTLTAPVLVYGEIESGRRGAAAAVSLVLVAAAFVIVTLVGAWQRRLRGRVA